MLLLFRTTKLIFETQMFNEKSSSLHLCPWHHWRLKAEENRGIYPLWNFRKPF